MSLNEIVTLKVKPGSNGGNGWTNTTASNGQPYSFKYSGGKDDKGDMETEVNSGTATLQLTLDTDRQRYTLNGVNFAGDEYNQLSWAPQDSATGSIVDINTQVESPTYCVQVTDTQSGANIPCDPMISNEPRPTITHS